MSSNDTKNPGDAQSSIKNFPDLNHVSDLELHSILKNASIEQLQELVQRYPANLVIKMALERRKAGGKAGKKSPGDDLPDLDQMSEENLDQMLQNLSPEQLQALISKNPGNHKIRKLIYRLLRQLTDAQKPESEYIRRKLDSDHEKKYGKRVREVRKPPVKQSGMGSVIKPHPELAGVQFTGQSDHFSENTAMNDVAAEEAQNNPELQPSPTPQNNHEHHSAPTFTASPRPL